MTIDTTLWRQWYRTTPHVYLGRRIVVFQAQVNMASVTYPVTELTFDTVTTGAYTDILPGYTLLLGTTAGADDLGRARVRAAASSTVIPIGRVSIGNGWGELTVSDNMYITVLKQRLVWSKTPYINSSGTVSLKDEQSYTNALALAPVAIAGSDYGGLVNSSNVLSVAFDASASYARATGASIAAYLWDFDGGTVTAGGTTQATATVEFAPGEYDVALTVTDTLGYTMTTYRWIVAATRTGTYRTIPVNVESIDRRYSMDGQTLRFTVAGFPIPKTTYPARTRVLLFETEIYGTPGTPGSLNDPTRGATKFSGWIVTEPSVIEASQDGTHSEVALECEDMAGWLKRIPQFPQLLLRASSASEWREAQSAIANLNGAVDYYLRHHTTALELADFFRSSAGGSYTFSQLSGEQGAPYDQCDRLARAMRHRFTCNTRGQLFLNPFPLYLPTAAQAATYSLTARTTTVQIALEPDDYAGVRYTDTRPPSIHWNNGSALLVSTQAGEDENRQDEPIFSVAPGSAPGQGVSAQDSGEQLNLSQTEHNVVEGNRYAAINAEQSTFEFPLARGGDAGIEPADCVWVTATLPADIATPRAFVLGVTNFLPLEMSVRYGRFGTKQQALVAERETSGQPATRVLKPTDGGLYPPYVPPTTYYPQPPLPVIPTGVVTVGTQILGFWGSDGYFYYTGNFDTPAWQGGPTWARYAIGASGALVMGVYNAFSPAGTVNAWLLTATQVRRHQDVFNPSGFSLGAATSLGGTSADANLQSERGLANFAAVARYRYGVGVEIWVTTDGDTWTLEETYAFWDTGSGNTQRPGVVIRPSDNLILTSAFTNTAAVGSQTTQGKKGTSLGTTWATADNPNIPSTGNAGLAFNIHVPFAAQSVAYHGYVEEISTDRYFRTYKVTGSGSPADVSPAPGGVKYGTATQFSTTTPDNDANTVLQAGVENNTASTRYSVDYSRNAASSWTNLVTPATDVPYRAGNFFSDNRNLALLWGQIAGGVGAIAVADLQTGTIDDRSGNLATLGFSGLVLNVVGGGR